MSTRSMSTLTRPDTRVARTTIPNSSVSGRYAVGAALMPAAYRVDIGEGSGLGDGAATTDGEADCVQPVRIATVNRSSTGRHTMRASIHRLCLSSGALRDYAA